METNNTNYMQLELEALAKKRVRKIKRFYNHLLIYSIGVVIFLLNEYCDAPLKSILLLYQTWFFMYCWTFIIVVQGLKIFIIEVVLGKNWEAKQMNKIIESESNNQNSY